MRFHQFNNNATEALFKLNHLPAFEQLWSLDTPWFEEPNYRRNGWSGVVKYVLTDEHDKPFPIFIKRQENHNCKTLLHPIKGIPTFRREFYSLQKLYAAQIPTLNYLYYGERLKDGKAQSILITQSLEGYQSFEDYFQPDTLASAAISEQVITHIMQTAGENTRLLHDANFRHGSLYPKHFFVKVENKKSDVRLIDLEKLKWYPFHYLVRFNDLSRIIRRRAPVSKQAVHIFIDAYLKHGKDLSQTNLATKLDSLLKKN